jgi:hypothetical protein
LAARQDAVNFLRIIPLLLLTGCSIQKFNQPPTWASAVTHHSRFFGISAQYQGYGVKLGWGSDTFTIVPVSTNKVYAAPIADSFKIGQSINPFNTTIVEDCVYGWEGQPPAPRYLKLFNSPKELP